MKEIRRRRHKQLVDDFKKRSRCWKLKAESLDLWITRFGKGYGPVEKQTM
jgi:hypothetical protein